MNKDTEYDSILQNIKNNSKYLRLPYSYHNFKQLIEEHSNLNSSIAQFYNDLLQKEADVRTQNSKESFKVLFTSAPTLINKLKECKSSRTLTSIQKQFEQYDLIILDELRLHII